MKPYKPKKIYIERAAKNFSTARAILERLPDIPVEEIDTPSAAIHQIGSAGDRIGEGKRSLLLAVDRGQSFKPFPESEDYLSCDYYSLHIAEGCDLECSYCILQAYLTNPLLTVYVNIHEMLDDLQLLLNKHPERFFRVGTGQLADSLSLDPITGYSRILVPFFAEQKNAVLELKTKSTFTENLLALQPAGKTIISWSMNTKKIQQEEEHKCAAIEERLKAAKTVLANPGYRVGFHFDPIIDYEGWENDYHEVLNALFSEIAPSRIAWVSLGCLRMMPRLKSIMQQRFPGSPLPQSEWAEGMDKKLRYFKPRRIAIYKRMAGMIRAFAPGLVIYLCMETPEVWHNVFGSEASRFSVCDLLDHAGKS